MVPEFEMKSLYVLGDDILEKMNSATSEMAAILEFKMAAIARVMGMPPLVSLVLNIYRVRT